jgi:hypothetical protein
LPDPIGSYKNRSEGKSCRQKSTEQDFARGVYLRRKQGINHKQGEPEPKFENWIDCLFLHGFVNQELFDSPTYKDGRI